MIQIRDVALVFLLTVTVNGHGGVISGVAKAQKAAKAAEAGAKAAKAGAVAAEASKATVAGQATLVVARVVGRLGACVNKQPKTVPRDAAEKSCFTQYENCVKKNGKGLNTEQINDRCVGLVNKNSVRR
jgi:hypothetical protein